MSKENEITVVLLRVPSEAWHVIFSEPVKYLNYRGRYTDWYLMKRDDSSEILKTDRLGAWLEAKWIAEQNGYTLVAGGPNGQRD